MDIQTIFKTSKVIAVVGMSQEQWKAAHTVPMYMKKQGYDIVPVNPFRAEIGGMKSYESIEAVPHHIDILNVFRPSDQVLDVVEAAIKRRKEKGDISVIWLQQGIQNEEARKLAEKEGIEFIEDQCIYVMHRFSEGM